MGVIDPHRTVIAIGVPPMEGHPNGVVVVFRHRAAELNFLVEIGALDAEWFLELLRYEQRFRIHGGRSVMDKARRAVTRRRLLVAFRHARVRAGYGLVRYHSIGDWDHRLVDVIKMQDRRGTGGLVAFSTPRDLPAYIAAMETLDDRQPTATRPAAGVVKHVELVRSALPTAKRDRLMKALVSAAKAIVVALMFVVLLAGWMTLGAGVASAGTSIGATATGLATPTITRSVLLLVSAVVAIVLLRKRWPSYRRLEHARWVLGELQRLQIVLALRDDHDLEQWVGIRHILDEAEIVLAFSIDNGMIGRRHGKELLARAERTVFWVQRHLSGRVGMTVSRPTVPAPATAWDELRLGVNVGAALGVLLALTGSGAFALWLGIVLIVLGTLPSTRVGKAALDWSKQGPPQWLNRLARWMHTSDDAPLVLRRVEVIGLALVLGATLVIGVGAGGVLAGAVVVSSYGWGRFAVGNHDKLDEQQAELFAATLPGSGLHDLLTSIETRVPRREIHSLLSRLLAAVRQLLGLIGNAGVVVAPFVGVISLLGPAPGARADVLPNVGGPRTAAPATGLQFGLPPELVAAIVALATASVLGFAIWMGLRAHAPPRRLPAATAAKFDWSAIDAAMRQTRTVTVVRSKFGPRAKEIADAQSGAGFLGRFAEQFRMALADVKAQVFQGLLDESTNVDDPESWLNLPPEMWGFELTMDLPYGLIAPDAPYIGGTVRESLQAAIEIIEAKIAAGQGDTVELMHELEALRTQQDALNVDMKAALHLVTWRNVPEHIRYAFTAAFRLLMTSGPGVWLHAARANPVRVLLMPQHHYEDRWTERGARLEDLPAAFVREGVMYFPYRLFDMTNWDVDRLSGLIIEAAATMLHEWVHVFDDDSGRQTERNAFWADHLFKHAWHERRRYQGTGGLSGSDADVAAANWVRVEILDAILRDWRPGHDGPTEYSLPQYDDKLYQETTSKAPTVARTGSAPSERAEHGRGWLRRALDWLRWPIGDLVGGAIKWWRVHRDGSSRPSRPITMRGRSKPLLGGWTAPRTPGPGASRPAELLVDIAAAPAGLLTSAPSRIAKLIDTIKARGRSRGPRGPGGGSGAATTTVIVIGLIIAFAVAAVLFTGYSADATVVSTSSATSTASGGDGAGMAWLWAILPPVLAVVAISVAVRGLRWRKWTARVARWAAVEAATESQGAVVDLFRLAVGAERVRSGRVSRFAGFFGRQLLEAPLGLNVDRDPAALVALAKRVHEAGHRLADLKGLTSGPEPLLVTWMGTDGRVRLRANGELTALMARAPPEFVAALLADPAAALDVVELPQLSGEDVARLVFTGLRQAISDVARASVHGWRAWLPVPSLQLGRAVRGIVGFLGQLVMVVVTVMMAVGLMLGQPGSAHAHSEHGAVGGPVAAAERLDVQYVPRPMVGAKPDTPALVAHALRLDYGAFVVFNAQHGVHFTGPHQSIAGVRYVAPGELVWWWPVHGDGLWTIFKVRLQDLAGYQAALKANTDPRHWIDEAKPVRLPDMPMQTPAPPKAEETGGRPGEHTPSTQPPTNQSPSTSSHQPEPPATSTAPGTPSATPWMLVILSALGGLVLGVLGTLLVSRGLQARRGTKPKGPAIGSRVRRLMTGERLLWGGSVAVAIGTVLPLAGPVAAVAGAVLVAAAGLVVLRARSSRARWVWLGAAGVLAAVGVSGWIWPIPAVAIVAIVGVLGLVGTHHRAVASSRLLSAATVVGLSVLLVGQMRVPAAGWATLPVLVAVAAWLVWALPVSLSAWFAVPDLSATRLVGVVRRWIAVPASLLVAFAVVALLSVAGGPLALAVLVLALLGGGYAFVSSIAAVSGYRNWRGSAAAGSAAFAGVAWFGLSQAARLAGIGPASNLTSGLAASSVLVVVVATSALLRFLKRQNAPPLRRVMAEVRKARQEALRAAVEVRAVVRGQSPEAEVLASTTRRDAAVVALGAAVEAARTEAAAAGASAQQIDRAVGRATRRVRGRIRLFTAGELDDSAIEARVTLIGLISKDRWTDEQVPLRDQLVAKLRATLVNRQNTGVSVLSLQWGQRLLADLDQHIVTAARAGRNADRRGGIDRGHRWKFVPALTLGVGVVLYGMYAMTVFSAAVTGIAPAVLFTVALGGLVIGVAAFGPSWAKWSRRLLMVVSLIVSSFGMALMALSGDWLPGYYIAAFVLGIAASANGPMLSLLGSWVARTTGIRRTRYANGKSADEATLGDGVVALSVFGVVIVLSEMLALAPILLHMSLLLAGGVGAMVAAFSAWAL